MCIAHTLAELPIDMGNFICNCPLTGLPFQLFLHSDCLLRAEIIPFSGVCQSGGEAVSTPEAVVASRTDRQTALMCNRRRPAATNIITQSTRLCALASANSFVYFASSAATLRQTHLHVGNCRVRQLQFSGIFVALGFVAMALSR